MSKVNKNEINNSGNKLTDKDKQNILEAIKNITFVSKDQLVKSSNSFKSLLGPLAFRKCFSLINAAIFSPHPVCACPFNKLREPVINKPVSFLSKVAPVAFLTFIVTTNSSCMLMIFLKCFLSILLYNQYIQPKY